MSGVANDKGILGDDFPASVQMRVFQYILNGSNKCIHNVFCIGMEYEDALDESGHIF